ncbi:c-type cytochrome [Campylobacter concisus]|uniref:c-type cytochrome n=1 Tax=Campylobacter concisus TaxID=199 RepID=UPI000CD9E323
MRSVFLILLFCVAIFGADFITKTEYAKMLYLNPRGIGCDKCHGAKGEGSLISKYKHFDKKANKTVDDELRAPKINDIEFESFKAALTKPKGVMPSYFLTDEETTILYEYITNQMKPPAKVAKSQNLAKPATPAATQKQPESTKTAPVAKPVEPATAQAQKAPVKPADPVKPASTQAPKPPVKPVTNQKDNQKTNLKTQNQKDKK